jgi:hypothetical protein
VKHPTLTRRQELALRFLAACPWGEHTWWSIGAALKFAGERCPNGRATAGSLVKMKLANQVSFSPSKYIATQLGRELAATLPKLEVR